MICISEVLIWKIKQTIVDLDASQTDLITKVIDYFRNDYDVEIRKTQYKFQKGSNSMLVIRK